MTTESEIESLLSSHRPDFDRKIMTWGEFKRSIEGKGIDDDYELSQIIVYEPGPELQILKHGDGSFSVID